MKSFNYLVGYLYLILKFTWIVKSTGVRYSSSCPRIDSLCYGTRWCEKITQNKIKPVHLSKRTCFGRNGERLTFRMGTDTPIFKSDGESPARTVSLSPFCMDQTEVSNLQFYLFVLETNYRTDAELLGDSLCLANLLSDQTLDSVKNSVSQVPWWIVLKNATWFTPEGIDSNIYQRWHHPVIHVSWKDADAYCKYFNKRLPTEAEWEYACRGGLEDRLYPWGNNNLPKGQHKMNIWQGYFPQENTVDDGYYSTAPVDKFNQNRYNMKNIVGNVWEWTNDWWKVGHSSEASKDRMGAESGSDKVKKGGSFMCTPAFCHRYRCAARSKNTPDTSAANLGFRCASYI